MSQDKPRTIESVTDIEIEYQHRKHQKTVFGTVNQSREKLAIDFLADEMEKNDVVKRQAEEITRLQKALGDLAATFTRTMDVNLKLVDEIEALKSKEPTLNSHPQAENEEEAY